MSFRFDPSPRFVATCKIRLDGPDGPIEEDFQAVFEAVPIDEFNTFLLGGEAGVRALLQKTLRDVRDVTDLDGDPIPYDLALRDRMINAEHIRQALVKGYLDGLRGN